MLIYFKRNVHYKHYVKCENNCYVCKLLKGQNGIRFKCE